MLNPSPPAPRNYESSTHMAVKQDINVGMVAFTGLVGAMLLLIIIWGVQGWYAYEVDLLRQRRNTIDDNVDWNRLKVEQYVNLADPVGNDTIFAAEVPGVDAAEGFRWVDDSKQAAAIPIHVAMAEIARRNGVDDASAERMKQADASLSETVNEAYGDYMTPTEAEPQSPDMPVVPQEESASEPQP